MRRIRRRARAAVVLSLVSALVLTDLPSVALAIPGDGMERGVEALELPELPESALVDPDADPDLPKVNPAEAVPLDPYTPASVVPWTEDTGVVDLTGAVAGAEPQAVEDLPIKLGVPEGGDAAAVAGEWTVDLAAPEDSQTAGVSGLIMKVTPPATVDPAAEVALSVVTDDFADLYGPQAADRFGLMLLPDCVYDSPGTGECAAVPPTGGTEDDDLSANSALSAADVISGAEALPTSVTAGSEAGVAARSAGSETRMITATVPVAKLISGSPSSGISAFATSSGSGVVGALDTGASVGGDYTASPLLSAGSWAAGSSSGAFTYAYQVQVPETAGGLVPKVGLSYSSQSVDGRTSSTNNQASWIGDGWDYAAGSITRTYTNCRQDSKKAGSNNAEHRTGDQCFGSRNATLSLSGMTTELVWVPEAGSQPLDEKGVWYTANGDGSKVELRKNTALKNGDEDGEYWVVTTRDGTQYQFGRHRLPGWSDHGDAADDPVTNSVLTVPVYGNHADEPCYKAKWTESSCYQGWRWNLDYVEDVHGNAMSMYWGRELNYYAPNFNFKDPVKYHRAGYLKRIDYGQRKDTVYTAAPLGRVTFDVQQRCYTEGSLTCTEENFTSKNPGNYRIWYDTPADLRCESGKMCWNASPSFFSRYRLDKITTLAQRTQGSTALQKVDEYQLAQSFPTLRMGANTALWLDSVTRTGFGTDGAGIKLNPVRFMANTEDMPNRLDNDARPSFSRLRIARVINEYLGETWVEYNTPTGACATGSGLPGKGDTAELKANTRLCFPAFWHPDGDVEDIDWFHKYVVTAIIESPNVDGGTDSRTEYEYSGPRWKLSEGEFSKKATRTYSQFAGFRQTAVYTGIDDDETAARRSKSVTRFFQGMGDSVPVTDVNGTEIAKDREPFAGRIAEELTYATDTADTATGWLTRSVNVPVATKLAERDLGDGLTPLRAWRVTEPRQITYTRSSGTGDDTSDLRTVETKTTFDEEYGLPQTVESLGDIDKTGDESCTKLEYLHHTAKNLIGLTKQTRTSPTTCTKATFDTLASLTSGSRVAYDYMSYGSVPSTDIHRGQVTQTWSLKDDGTGFQSDSVTTYDNIGRVKTTADDDGNTSKITYEPANGQVYKVISANALDFTETQTLEPGRAVTVQTVDINNLVSGAAYDALGRMVTAWGPGRSKDAPDFTATYTLPSIPAEGVDSLPPYVTTKNRGHDGTWHTSVSIYDGLGRERQSQEQGTGGGRLVTDTIYNASGEIRRTNNAYFTEGTPSGQLFSPLADTAIPNATRYIYDDMGRVVEEIPVLDGTDTPARGTKYQYGADWSTVINPAGSASYRMFNDALGRTTRVDTFTNTARTTFTTMRYEYNSRGYMVKATNSADTAHPWTWSYDLRGRLVSATDPDTGTTTNTYDKFDQVVTTTNARGVVVWNEYDALARPKQQRLGGKDGTLLADYTYDKATNGKGLPTTVTRYTDGLGYTQSISGFTPDYQPTATTISIPASVATTWGLKSSYSYNYSYTDTGLTETASLPAVGSLPAEKLLVRYTNDGLPLSVSGKDWYGAETVYSPSGQVLRSTLGAQPYRVWATAGYDEASGALTKQMTHREQLGSSNTYLVSSRSYGYDDAGNVTAIREQAAATAERQCFTYDTIGQLTKAWTSKDQATCAAGPISSGVVNAVAGADGAGYWQEYEYDLRGNRTKLVERNLTGNPAADSAAITSTTTYDYGKADGSQPQTLTKVSKAYVTAGGAQVKAEATRLYALTGETTSVTSVQTGDSQQVAWTHDGQVERITGEGNNGKSAYIGLADKCIDLSGGTAAVGTAIHLYSCNNTIAQKWGFVRSSEQTDPNLGALTIYDNKWCAQPAANTATSAVKLQKCDGSAAQNFKRNTTTGQLAHPASGLCVMVKDANSASATPLVLAACDTTSLAQQWQPQNETRFIYGPSGGRLMTIQGKDKQATLHLGESEITVLKGGALVNTQRSYPAPGGTVMRYAYGNGSAGLVAITSDHQGTPNAEVALASGMSYKLRKQDAFGNQRGASYLSQNMQTHTGFLGATSDDASGFVPLGARFYDPAVGRFLSADPVLDLTDPQQTNGYTYSHNNPVTHSDPTGMSITLNASEMAAALAGAGLSAAQVADAQAMMGKSLTDVILSAAWGILSEFIGLADAIGCFGGDMWACGSLILGAIPWGKLMKLPKIAKAIDRTIAAIQAFRSAKKAAEAVIAAARAAETAALNAKKLAIERAKKAAQAAKKKAADKVNTTSNSATNGAKKTGSPGQKQAQAKANPSGSSVSSGGGGGKAKPGGASGASNRSNGGTSGDGGGGKSGDGAGDAGGPSCLNNSFVPGTKVLLADGSTKAIEDVEPGDEVKVTDPETGETRIEQVTATITGSGVKHLVEITLDSDEKVTATDGHPFWVPELSKWVEATDLKPGQWLRTGSGSYVQISAIKRWTAPSATVYNLTVSNLHTYFVIADQTSLLVHNCQVEYGSTDLSQAVIQARLQSGNTGNTYAAVRYRDDNGVERIAVDHSIGGRDNHGEQRLHRQYGSSIIEMYVEFQPCVGRNQCRREMAEAGIPVSYTWPWDKSGSALATAAQKERLKFVRQAFRDAKSGNWGNPFAR
ncbi:RHS repeat-associated protein [Actinoplanes lutulentus]|nr:polymorphic toxin-type HINT domain-containing protein [Actinoplanes lutulentus]MBB2947666.1 RHS repeat-associated protein [Actinoplanes lutulentus]